MPDFLKKSTYRYSMLFLILVSVLTIGLFAFYNWILALVFIPIYIVAFYRLFKFEVKFKRETEEYFTSFSKRFHGISEQVVEEFPVGVILYNESFKIEWVNQFMSECCHEKVSVGQGIESLSEDLFAFITNKKEENKMKIGDRIYKIEHRRSQKLIYLNDVTQYDLLKKTHIEEKTAICMIFLDNYDDIVQAMDDQKRSQVQNLCTNELVNWAKEHGMLLRRVSSDKYIAIMNERILKNIEKAKFSILDEVRLSTMKQQGTPLTLSIGVGSGSDSIPELGELAQSGLDLALGRGGDQAVIKMVNGKARFYGGKTNPTGKRTRVRARVISHALHDLILDSENVIIMGHKNPDLDVYGAAMGILRLVEVNDRSGYVVVDDVEKDHSITNFFSLVHESEALMKKFVSKEHVLDLVTDKTLLIVVDTHRPSMVIVEKLLKMANKIVVIDHHRRGEEMIENPILTYMEPYASSTAELVTELIEYHPKIKKLEIFDATALLAGIVLDTSSFTQRTGARTFDAASFLRFHGADVVQVQNMFKEDVGDYVKRLKLIESVYFYKPKFAISVGQERDEYSQVQIAKAADTLLAMSGIEASFVIAKKNDSDVAISARSSGDVNVQVIMEMLGGGGHLTNAATQLSQIGVNEVKKTLQQAIDMYLEGSS